MEAGRLFLQIACEDQMLPTQVKIINLLESLEGYVCEHRQSFTESETGKINIEDVELNYVNFVLKICFYCISFQRYPIYI